MPKKLDASKPLYEAMADALREQIRAGRLKPGQRVPSESELCQLYGVGRNTVRHAIAEDRDEFAASGHDDDRLRPLTTDGVRKMKRGAEGLRAVVPSMGLLAASPLVRAAETAEIIREVYGLDRVVTEASLVPEGGVAGVATWLGTRREDSVAIVGHEPQLGRLVSYLIGAGDRPAVELKKGAACILELDGPAGPGAARLIAALPPRVLRGLAG